MASLISHLSKADHAELLNNLNYLNVKEITEICQISSIPISIFIEASKGEKIKTSDKERKGVLLERIWYYLKSGKVSEPTVLSKKIVRFDDSLKNPRKLDRIYYNQYDKKNKRLLVLLKALTGGRFKDGAIARILLREFWSQGEAPTIEKFARHWLEAQANHTRPNPEWAFLSDLSRGAEVSDWKALRVRKAKSVLKLLKTILSKGTHHV